MRACFMGQNIFALGFGTATLQSPPLVMDKPLDLAKALGKAPAQDLGPTDPADVANPQRPDPARPRGRITVI